ncbi:TRAP transporter substrate-binding protein DctP [Arcobacter sp. F2176]|uniref:TRAP transporter substrate-binding protein DctP n=1 Tax=unclassified Arcobacter TaxID=2593671 RepID=UPI00100BE78D|nr:TRAP transporter substrate-binding protein DctP [Arcobacter sp. F2176]RXJ81911.1 C4-dicarboxylate ABC transporter [Arcobacter sp. F2176]|eukprot:TRINITY_DN4013_c0_g3_i2.p1 TRINITY_DN4013_c0_g3~~TRINITY_DN4013_c0_g3_i2.p1  ORF type:complete len:338 (+),score=-11.14 TRINITY_DN4013_c0_g3_i2:451-1464(+)
MKLINLKSLVLAGMIAATSLSAATWKYAMGEGLDDPQGIYAVAFKNYIESHSDNKIKIYPVGSLGEETDLLEQTKFGLLQFLGQSTGYMGGTIPEMDLFTLPYVLPTDTKELDYFFKNSKAINKMLPPIFNKHGLELLAVFPEGEMAITTNEVFRTPEDLQGKKMRVMPGSPILVDTYEAFGASPVPMSWGDLIGALKTNMVDGEENPTVWIEAYDLDKLSKVLTYMGHSSFNACAVTNKKFYDKLSAKDKKLVQDASAHAEKVILKEAQKLDAYGLGRIVRTNPDYKIVTLTKEEREVFKKRAKPVQEKFAEKSDSNKKLLAQMRKDLEEAEKNAK